MRFRVARCAILLAASTLSACGGGGGESSSSSTCPVDIDSLSNGATRETATSVWRCTADRIPDFSFMFFRDGTGLSSAIGNFQWTETECGVVNVEGDVPQTISDISVNADKDEASFVTEQSTGTASVSCQSQSNRPDPRTGHVASYDTENQKMLVRGGAVAFGDSDTRVSLADTWTFDGSDWEQLAPSTVPPIASAQAMVYDAARQKSVLVSGRRESDILQTWEFDGEVWNRADLSVAPSQRTSFHITYDSTRDVIVLFGGRAGSDNTGSRLYDTWEYDGNEWTKRVTPDGTQCSSSTSNSPCIHSGSMAAMAYDPSRGKTVLVGKSASSTSVRTYEWDGSDWMERSPVQEPDIPSSAAMTHDRARNVSVIATPQLWEWDGTHWQDTGINTNRLGQTAVYSTKSMATVLFGGESGQTLYNDVQTFDGTTLR